MNIRKNIDYSDLFAALDAAMQSGLQQMEQYCELGRLVSNRPEKGAAVVAAAYLKMQYPETSGFSPRNLRRMRDFYRLYEGNPDMLELAMQLSWTQNVVILEAELNTEERRWYLQAAKQFDWSKIELLREITSAAHLNLPLDELMIICYTKKEREDWESHQENRKNTAEAFMELADCLQIFDEEYARRRAEFEFPEFENKKLLEERYPEPDGPYGEAKPLRDRIKGYFESLTDADCREDESFSVRDVFLLYRQAYFEYKLFGKRDARFVSLFHVLNAYTGVNKQFKKDVNIIRNLAKCTIDLWLANETLRDGLLGERLDQIVAAVKRLRHLCNGPVIVENGEIVLSDTFLEPIHEEMERRMNLAGGMPVLQRLFCEELAPRFDHFMGRYMIHRQSQSYYGSKDLPEPEIPFGYLFQIAVKHLFPPIVDVRPRCGIGYEEIIRMAKDVLLVFDVSRAYPMPHLFTPVNELPKYTVSNAILDNLCLPPQYAPQFCSLIMGVYESERKHVLPDLFGIKKISCWCLEQPPCKMFSAQEVAEKTKLPLYEVEKELNLFSVPWNRVNKEYTQPISLTNQWNYPLIQAPYSGQYFQLSPHFSGFSFCDRLYTLMFDKDNTVGRRLGEHVEVFVKELLDKKGIPYHSGYYKDKKIVQSECDVILEDNENILFMEIKKCPLGDGFRRADDVEIFHSLADGMLAGQVQAHRHRKLLTQKGSLSLYKKASDSNVCYTLKLNNRQVHMMSICLPEYAFFTQAFLCEKFLLALLQVTFNTIDPALAPRLEKINGLAEKFRKLIAQEGTMGDDLRKYTSRSYFRSLQQLWLVLKICQTKEQVIGYLTWDSHVVYGAMDYYAGLKEWHRMQNHT